MANGQNPQDQQQVPPTQNPRQNISTGLTQMGFNLLGSALAEEFNDPSLATPLQQMGTNIVNTLRTRWYQKEHEDFQTLYGKQYQTDSQSLFDSMTAQMEDLAQGIIGQNPDGSAVIVDPQDPRTVRMRDNVLRTTIQRLSQLDDSLMENADKYPGNPIISGKIQNLIQHRSQMVSELTGPTVSQQSEAALGGIEETRQKAGYYSRMPAAGAGTGKQKSLKEMSPREIMQRVGGPVQMMEWLVGTPEGQQHMEGYQDMAAGQLSQQLIAEDPILATDQDSLSRRLGEFEGVIDKRAAGLYMADTFGQDMSDKLANVPRFKQEGWFPKEAIEAREPVIKTDLSKREADAAIKSAYQPALASLDQIARSGNYPSIEAAIAEWEVKFLQPYMAQNVANIPATRRFRNRLSRELRDWISKKNNWATSDYLAEKYAGGKKPSKFNFVKSPQLSSEDIETAKRSADAIRKFLTGE